MSLTIVVIFSSLFFRELITATKRIGLFAVALGMCLVNGKALMQGGFSWGHIYGVMSAVMYAFMVIFNKKATSITGLENSIYQLTVSFLIVAVFTLIKQGIVFTFASQSIFPILFLGIVNTGIGCYLYFSSIQKLSAGSVAICGYLEPISALILSALLLQEKLTLIQVGGAVSILVGAAFGEFFHHSRNTDS